MNPLEEPGIVLAPYGTLHPPALATYEEIRAAYERQFPGSPVRLAFTSSLMRKRLKETKGISIASPLAALAQLQDQGCRSAVVQSLQIVPGVEFHQLASLVHGLRGADAKLAFERLEIGLPLLSSLEDCQRVSRVLPAFWTRGAENGVFGEDPEDSEKEAILLVGHGTGHPADSIYSLMAEVLKKDHRNVFLGTLEGFPGIRETIAGLKRCGAKKVRMMPFLLIAGGHAQKDIAGNDPASWMSNLIREGFEVEVNTCGMGESQEIVTIFLEHTRNSLQNRFLPKGI